jgi:hypothetical protein
MNPFFILLILVVVAALGWRGVRRERARVSAALRDAEAALRKRRSAGSESLTLERDPKTGVYRPPPGRGD